MKRLLTLITLLWFTPHIIPALADELSTGEYAYNNSGDPAIIGQCVMDHLFARNEFIDANGNSIDIDNIVSFKDNNTQLIWLWLDDDQIYSNQAVQALTPMAYNETGDLYSEITYSSCQFDIYLPGSVSLVKTESNQNAMWGDRLPLSSIVSWYKDSKKKGIDGIEYERYLVTIMGSLSYGSHFS